MDVQMEKIKEEADEKWKLLGLKETATAETVMEFINREDFRAASGTMAPMAEKRPKGLACCMIKDWALKEFEECPW